MRGSTPKTGIGLWAFAVAIVALMAIVASPAQARQLPNLKVSSATAPEAMAPGDRALVGDRTANRGGTQAGLSTTSYLLSKDRSADRDDVHLRPGRKIRKLGSGGEAAGMRTVGIPMAAPAGRYFLLACADGHRQVAESSESDNCATAPGKVQVISPGAVEPHLNLTPSSFDFGAIPFTHTVTDPFTAVNPGPYTVAVRKAVTTGRYFSVSASDCLNRILVAGATCSGTVTASADASGLVEGELRFTTRSLGLATAPLQFTGGQPAPAPTLGTDDDQVFFPGTIVYTKSAPQGFFAFNVGTGTTGTLSVQLSGPDADQFDLDMDGCTGETMTSGAQCVVRYFFAPTTAGTKTATVTVSGVPGGSVSGTLQGVGQE